MALTCSKCGKPGEFRAGHKQCLECERQYNREYYASNLRYFEDYRKRNRKHYREQNVEILRRTRAERYQAYEFLKSLPCTDCKVSYPPYVMDHDHRDPLLKTGNVSEMVKTPGIPWERVLEEVSKCDLVCANCHRIRTHQRKHPRACDRVRMSSERMRWSRHRKGSLQTDFRKSAGTRIPKVKPWHALVGLMSDKEVSRRTGISRSSVCMYRQKMGIPRSRKMKNEVAA